jgi:hypothetical protein
MEKFEVLTKVIHARRTLGGGKRIAELLVEPATDRINAFPVHRMVRDNMVTFSC